MRRNPESTIGVLTPFPYYGSTFSAATGGFHVWYHVIKDTLFLTFDETLYNRE